MTGAEQPSLKLVEAVSAVDEAVQTLLEDDDSSEADSLRVQSQELRRRCGRRYLRNAGMEESTAALHAALQPQ